MCCVTNKNNTSIGVSLLSVVACCMGSTYGFSFFGLELFPFRLFSAYYLFVVMAASSFFVKDRLFRAAVYYLLYMLLYGFISLMWSPDLVLGFKTWGIIFNGTIFVIFILKFVRNRRMDLHIWMRSWAFVVILVSVVGVYEFFTGNYVRHIDDSVIPGMARLMERIGWNCPRAFWHNHNNYAFVNALSALSIYGWAMDCRGRDRFLGITASFVCAIMVLLSYSRAAIGGLFLGMTCILLVSFYKSKLRFNKFTLIAGLAVLVLLSFGFFENIKIVWNAVAAVLEKVEYADNNYRIGAYIASLKHGIVVSCGFGRGLGASTVIISGGSYHHYMLEVLAELGLWTFVGYCALFLALCARFWRNIRYGCWTYWSAGLLASCLAFPLLCAGPSGIFGEGVFWLWLAILIAFACLPCEFSVAGEGGGRHG